MYKRQVLDNLLAIFETLGEFNRRQRIEEADKLLVRFGLTAQRKQYPPTLSGGERRKLEICLLYTSPSPRDRTRYRMPSSA